MDEGSGGRVELKLCVWEGNKQSSGSKTEGFSDSD